MRKRKHLWEFWIFKKMIKSNLFLYKKNTVNKEYGITLREEIQDIFEIGNRFWAHENQRPNFDKLTKNKVFTKPLINKHRANHKLPPMYKKR